jgi:CxxC-x17-CxxC domain-containing protein
MHSIDKRCLTCGEEFLVPGAERQFRTERGLSDPQTCPECRARARSARNADVLALVSAAGNGDAYGSPAPGHRSRGGQRGRANGGPSQRYPAVCAACGAETMVPFVPRRDRPVFCRDCFNARRGR